MIDWKQPRTLRHLPVACDWAKPNQRRVLEATGRHVLVEASRATLEAVTRKLRTRGWVRRRTSVAKWDGRSESRYYRSPRDPKYEIRISNHLFPGAQPYHGAKDYLVDAAMMMNFSVFGFIAMIERDERQAASAARKR